MKQKLTAIIEKNSVFLLSYALTLTLSLSVFAVYDFFAAFSGFALAAGAAVYCLLLFLLCTFVEKHHVIGGILFVILAYAFLQIFMMVSRLGLSRYNVGFLEWLLTRGSDVEGATYYMIALFLFFPTFFGITIYYFSNALYRMFFLTLISLIPCVLYVKVVAEINNVYLVLIALLNVGIFMMHRKKQVQTVRNLNQVQGLLSSLGFVLLLFLMTALIPKNTQTPYYDDFEDLFMGGDTTSDIDESFSGLSEFSGDATGFLSTSNRKLYTLAGDPVSYLKRQNFDYYDFKKDRWYTDKEYAGTTSTLADWHNIHMWQDLPSLRKAFVLCEEYAPGFLEKYGLTEVAKLEMGTAIMQEVRVKSENFRARYLLAPSNCINMVMDTAEEYYITPSGAVYFDNTTHPSDFSYTILFYDDMKWQELWLENGGSDFTNEEALEMLTELRTILAGQDDMWANVATAYLRQQVDANYYRKLCEENTVQISDEIRNLAEEITKDADSDWKKAEALEAYFHTTDFVYDLGYNAPDDSPEYFLFTSKRGTCSDYASAYVLMARSVGLTVRYAEGYIPETGDAYWQYYVKNRGSHAYPEVFIQNMGWVVFEPTSTIDGTSFDGSDFLSFFSKLRMDYGLVAVVIGFILLLMALVVMIRVLLPLISEGLFRIRLHCADTQKGTILAYGRIVRKASRSLLRDAHNKTPYELAEFLSSIGCDIHSFCFLTEKILYSTHAVDEFEKKLILTAYKSACKALRRNRKSGTAGHHKS